jgi:hypothetical protein
MTRGQHREVYSVVSLIGDVLYYGLMGALIALLLLGIFGVLVGLGLIFGVIK